ncbi:unnamed protein product [Clavelina lepadiformis]|uniref:Cilia- and flagella-associated protein 74 n=1 Tax=Clavelina lepadiformis TaxID=159417 RepID=A0ABP0FTD5_CLALP
MESVERIAPMRNFEDDSSDEDDYGHQYDDFEDLFSIESGSVVDDFEDKEIGKYLVMDPGFQKQVAQLIMLRRHLDSLQEKLSEKEFVVLKCREELNASRTRIQALEKERLEVAQAIVDAEENNKVAAFYRLVSQKEKLSREIENEHKIVLDTQSSLQEAELAQSKVEIEQRHYVNLAEQVVEKEEKVTQHKQKMAKYRLSKEQRAVKVVEERFKKAQEILEDKVEQRRAKQEQVMKDAVLNHEKAKKFLKQSLSKVRQREALVQNSHQAQVDKKVQNIISLKNNISANRENLRALQARDAAFEKKRENAEEVERRKVLKEGGNPELVLLQRKKLQEFEKEKQQFAAKQKANKARIVASILNEEENLEKRKKQQPHLWPDRKVESLKEVLPLNKPPIDTKIELDDKDDVIFIEQAKYYPQTPNEDIQREVTSVESVSAVNFSNVMSPPKLDETSSRISKIEDDVNLAQPEFPGLWDKKHKPYKVGMDDAQLKPVGGTKMEREILQQTLDKHRDGIIITQVAAGREFKGQPFSSKPDVIHFKDLNVGKTYKKKIIITNVSYTINFLKLTGLSEHLKDFIKIDFTPPGQMSAGMSCDMFVTFKPMINEDLKGEVFFLAQTGPFSIPLVCSVKKCELSVDVDSIDFGTQVVGETLHRSVTLINKGAQGTRFEFLKVPDKAPTTYTMETSLGRLTTAASTGLTANDVSEPPKTTTTAHPDATSQSKRTIRTEEPPETTDTSQAEGLDVTEEDYDAVGENESREGGLTRDEGDEITFETPTVDYDTTGPDELKVGQVMSGEIDPFSSVRLDIVFAPCVPGDIQANFRITFANQESDPIDIKASAVAIDVPVWLDRKNIDLKICMYDRLYQDQILVHNRASTALRLNFEVPKELRNHMELLPKTGYIQARSTFTAQLKFLPQRSLCEDAGGLFEPGSGILECPMVIRVADQTRPVPFVVNAVVTSSDLEFDQSEVDFGFCGINESIVSSIKLTNRSILPQKFGFVSIPDFVDVQPNDGFGTILPQETMDLDVVVSVKRAREYNFTLLCRSGINRDFPVHCTAVGVHPPLELSQQVIYFPATALDDVTTAFVHVINNHTSANEFTHPVPRIGKGDIVPVGATSFEFMVPEGAPVSITPAVGTVNPGEKCHVTLEFSPKLLDDDIRKEACSIIKREKEEKQRVEQEKLRREAEEQTQTKPQEEEKNTKGKKTPKTPAKSKASESSSKPRRNSAKFVEKVDDVTLTADMIDEKSPAYKSARASIMRSYPGSFQSFTIPCYVAPGRCSENADTALSYDKANTLFLEVHCPVEKPPVVVISNHGHNLTDFGQVSIGQNDVKPISVQNISDHPVELKLSLLDTSGPFQVLNALRALRPDETHTVLVAFTPNAGKVFYEVLKITCSNATLDVCLTGRGVSPVIKLDPEDSKLDLGHVLKGESSEATFTLENLSSLAVKYNVNLDSNSLLRHKLLQQAPEFVRRDGEPRRTLMGTQNNSGLCVFDCVPCQGEVKPGDKHVITVTFKPDHQSRHFSDGARVVLFNTKEAHVVHLTGKAHDHMMYLDGYDPLDVSVESLAADGNNLNLESEEELETQSVLMKFRSKVSEDGFVSVSRDLLVGCIRTNAFVGRKSGEWIVENAQTAQSKGFSIEPMKSSVEVGSSKPITFTWTPPSDHDPNVPLLTSVLLTLKGDVPMMFDVMLSGLVAFK